MLTDQNNEAGSLLRYISKTGLAGIATFLTVIFSDCKKNDEVSVTDESFPVSSNDRINIITIGFLI
jgi:hypothetical protein